MTRDNDVVKGSDCKDCTSYSKSGHSGKVISGVKSKGKMNMDEKTNGKRMEGGSDEIFCGSGESEKMKSKYQRSMSLIPNWKIRDHFMRLPFLRNNSQQGKQ